MSFLRYIFILQGIILMSLVKFIWKNIKMLIPLKYKMKNVTGEIALVTGGANGLGRSIALELSNAGVIVVIWDINENGIKETVKLVQDAGGVCYGYVCDLLNRQEIYEKAAQLRKEVGKVTILVNNAGRVNVMTFQDTPDDLLLRTMELNTISQFWTVKAFLPAMLESNKGHIVSIASVVTCMSVPLLTDYAASKHALIGFYEGLDKELNITANKVKITIMCPSFIHSTGFKAQDILGFIPLLSPEEVAMKTVIAMRCNKKYVVLPGYINIIAIMARIFPWGYTKMIYLSMKSMGISVHNDKMLNKQ